MTNSASHISRPPRLRRLYIFGCGGSGREVAWLAQEIWGSALEIAFLVDHCRYLCGPIDGHPVMLLDDADRPSDTKFVVALGDPHLRRAMVEKCVAAGHEPATLVHPRVEHSQRVRVGEGAVVCAGTALTTNVVVNAHVQINLGCTISHDVRIGDFSTLSPSVHVSGHVHIGREVFIGIGACIINGTPETPLVIGDGAIVAAGACVTHPVDANVLVAGVPAVRKR